MDSVATRSNSRLRGWTIMLLVGGMCLTGAFRTANAQNDTKRRDKLDSLLETLIESELDRREYGGTGRIEEQVRPLTMSSADTTKLRRLLSDFATESAQLAYQLDEYDARVPGLRNHLSDALRLRARADVLSKRVGRADLTKEIRPEYETLDRDWRRLSHAISQIRNTPRSLRDQITTLEGLEQDLAEMLKVRPQLDRVELMRQTAALTADLENLLEDIEIELGGIGESNSLTLSGRKALQQASSLTQTIADNYGYDTISADYKRFKEIWYPLVTRLRPLQNRYIERSVRRIRTVDNRLHDLLWLDQKVDDQQLLHVTSVLTKDVDEFFTRTPLKLLINLPNGYEVIPVADEFYGVLQNFADVVTRGESFESMVDAYQYVDESGEQFVRTFSQINSRSALSVLNEIERSLESLRTSLKLQDSKDLSGAIDLAATLEIQADRLDIDTNNWLNHKRESFRTEALKATAGFAQATHQLHEGLVNGADVEQLRRETSDLFSRWRTVYSYISRCDTEDRPILARQAAKITPGLVELRTLLEP